MSGRWRMLGVALLLGGCADGGDDPEPGTAAIEEAGAPDSAGGAVDAYIRPTAEGGELIEGDTVPGLPSWTRQDWEVLRQTVAWAWEQGIDSLPVGDRVARIGETFVGAPYVPQTLDPPGPERLVINLRALDCVTYVENMLVLAHFVRTQPRSILERPEDAMRAYGEMLTRVRYRGGRLDGYPSRLHYFTEWIRDNEARGLVDNITAELGGVMDSEPIDFMSTHRDAYRQLEDDAVYATIAPTEARLSATPRPYIPQARVADVADRIRSGDIIAATSTLEGLDIAHTGIALWKDGALHLMHAPLVGKNVEISEKPLAERLLGISSQDGIMVARPQELPGR